MSERAATIISDSQEATRLLAATLHLRQIRTRILRLDSIDLDQVADTNYQITVLDVARQDDEALTACRQLRECIDTPIILLTHVASERYLLQAYNHGADECVTKPIGAGLLLAKLNVWFRFSVGYSYRDPVTHTIGFHINHVQRKVTTPEGTTVRLSRQEFKLLDLFLHHPNHILSSEHILEHVWPDMVDFDTNANFRIVKNMVYRLRQKIEPLPGHPAFIQTVRGEGYAFYINENKNHQK